jgi:hypothetical protein
VHGSYTTAEALVGSFARHTSGLVSALYLRGAAAEPTAAVVAFAAGLQSDAYLWLDQFGTYDAVHCPVPEGLKEPQSTEDRLSAAIASTQPGLPDQLSCESQMIVGRIRAGGSGMTAG